MIPTIEDYIQQLFVDFQKDHTNPDDYVQGQIDILYHLIVKYNL